jgi:hypothetical protein
VDETRACDGSDVGVRLMTSHRNPGRNGLRYPERTGIAGRRIASMPPPVVYRAAVLSSDAGFGLALCRSLLFEGILARFFTAEAQFKRAFGHGFASVFQKNPPRYACENPELVIVDLDEPASPDPLEPGRTIVSGGSATEVMVICSEPSPEVFAGLILSGMGTIMKKRSWQDQTHSLQAKARQLCQISVERRNYRLLRKAKLLTHGKSEIKAAFLSHASLDRIYSRGVRRFLEAEGISTWYSFDDGTRDDSWLARLNEALVGARVFLPLITERFLTSGRCRDECASFERRMSQRSDLRRIIIPPPASFDPPILRPHSVTEYLEVNAAVPRYPATFKDYLSALVADIWENVG